MKTTKEDNGLNDGIRDLFEELKRLRQRDKELWDIVYNQIKQMPQDQERQTVRNRIYDIEKELGL